MKIKIRLDGRKKVATLKGFPVIYYLTKDSEDYEIKTGYHSKKNDWNKKNALPEKTHPKYIEIINYLEVKKIRVAKLLELSKIKDVNFHYAEKYIINVDTGIFYKDGLNVSGGRTYKIALNSFQKIYPDYSYSMITKKVTKTYMETILNLPNERTLKPRSPNGVISYMNTLTAIWTKLDKPNNPFSAIRPISVPTKDKDLTIEDLINIKTNLHLLKDKVGSICSHKKYMKYFLLCFYLGGIDLYYLKEMRYDKHVINGRIEFYRKKGKKFVKVCNIIPDQALELLKEFDCYPYLVPIYQLKNYDGLIPNISRDFKQIQEILQISKKPYSKAPRYTFINFGQDLLIDERIMKILVGHHQQSTHSVYKRELPYHIRDEAHKEIVNLINNN